MPFKVCLILSYQNNRIRYPALQSDGLILLKAAQDGIFSLCRSVESKSGQKKEEKGRCQVAATFKNVTAVNQMPISCQT